MNTKVKFTPSPDLLRKIIISQNGDIKNGIRELIQNSIDSYSGLNNTNKTIELILEDFDNLTGSYHKITCRDYGKTLGKSKEEVIRNFFLFGESTKGIDDIGQFGIGRGQTIAMIYSEDSKTLLGNHKIYSGDFIIQNIDLENLSAEVTKSDKRLDGTSWEITSNVPMFYKDEIHSYLKSNYRGEIPLFLNESQVTFNLPDENDVQITNNAEVTICVDRDKTIDGYGMRIYERGIFVRTQEIISGFSGTVMVKVPLPLNFARNEIKDCELWTRIKDKVLDSVLTLSTKKEFDDCSKGKKYGLAKVYTSSDLLKDRMKNMPIVELVNGKWITPDQLDNIKEIYTGTFGSVIAKEAMARGFTVISETSPFANWLRKNRPTTKDFKDTELAKEMRGYQYKTVIPSGRCYEGIALLNNIFSQFGREIKLGQYPDVKLEDGTLSKRTFAWTVPSEKVIWINKVYLQELMKGNNLDRLPLKAIKCLAHEYAHEESNIETDYHGYEFESAKSKIMEKLIDCLDEYIDQIKMPEFDDTGQRMLLESIISRLDKNNRLHLSELFTDNLLSELVERGYSPEQVWNEAIMLLIKHKFVDESQLDEFNLIHFSRRDLLKEYEN